MVKLRHISYELLLRVTPKILGNLRLGLDGMRGGESRSRQTRQRSGAYLSGRTKHASQSAGSMTENALGHRPTRSPLVQEGTPEFEARCQDAMDKVCQKYADSSAGWDCPSPQAYATREAHGAVSDDHRTPARTGRPPWGGGEVSQYRGSRVTPGEGSGQPTRLRV